MGDIVEGRILKQRDTFPADGPDRYRTLKITTDRARRLEFVYIDHEEPAGNVVSLSVNRRSTPEAIARRKGELVIGADRVTPGITWVAQGAYINYNFDATPLYSQSPVNQWPYILRWRQHLSEIVEGFNKPDADIFASRNRKDGYSHETIRHTADQQRAIETVSVVVRRLVGLIENRIEEYSKIDAATSDTWKAKTLPLDELVRKLCEGCSARGWKSDFIYGLSVFYSAFSVYLDPDKVTFFRRNDFNHQWAPTTTFPDITADELDQWLNGWNRAVGYYHETNGTEGDLYLDASLPTV